MSALRRRWMMATLLFIYLFAGTATAHAENDYAPDSEAWNGLSILGLTAKKIGVQWQTTQLLDWSALDEHQVLLLVGPRVAPTAHDKAQLTRFLQAGGHVIVADDFLQGRAWTAEFGLRWHDTGGRSNLLLEGNPHLPRVQVSQHAEDLRRAKPWLDPRAKLTPPAFLGHNVQASIVLNHPAVLTVDAGAQATLWGRYDRCNLATSKDNDCGWLAESAVEDGRVLAVADGSILLNQMLTRIYENKQLAANLLRYYCVVDRPCQVHMVANLAQTQGTFVAHHPPAERDWRAGLRALDRTLAKAATWLQDSWFLPVLLALLLWALWRPLQRAAQVRLPVLPPRPAPAQQTGAVASTVGAWLAAEDADYRQPAAILARHLLQLLARLDTDWADGLQPGGTIRDGAARAGQGALRRSGTWRREGSTIDALVRGGRCSPDAGARLREVLNHLQEATQDGAPPLPRRQFGHLAAEVEWAESLLRYTQNSKEKHV